MRDSGAGLGVDDFNDAGVTEEEEEGHADHQKTTTMTTVALAGLGGDDGDDRSSLETRAAAIVLGCRRRAKNRAPLDVQNGQGMSVVSVSKMDKV